MNHRKGPIIRVPDHHDDCVKIDKDQMLTYATRKLRKEHIDTSETRVSSLGYCICCKTETVIKNPNLCFQCIVKKMRPCEDVIIYKCDVLYGHHALCLQHITITDHAMHFIADCPHSTGSITKCSPMMRSEIRKHIRLLSSKLLIIRDRVVSDIYSEIGAYLISITYLCNVKETLK